MLIGSAQLGASEFNSERGPLSLEPLVSGLEHPWGLAFLPQQQGFLITERPGRLRWLDTAGRLSPPLAGVPAVYGKGQGGLLDVALSPDFARERWVYLSYAEVGEDGQAGTAVGRGRLAVDNSALEDFSVIFRQTPKLSTGAHFGSRLVFDTQGYLFITLGDNNQRAAAQGLDKLQGKVVRLHADGRVPADNPWVGQAGVRAEIWSYGHRNPQGAALNPWSGQLWTHEHGPRGGDEINIPKAGKNYGWPLATHGVNYSFLPIPEAQGKVVAGTEPALHVWAKSPALSGMAFYDGERFTAWRNNLFIGALAGQALLRLQLDGDRVVHEERLLQGKARIRDVRQGPDGYLYLLTDAADGQLLRLGLRED
ncbi:PQQ-dependent sugar dehydrogenase [Pseudomonas xionganensis]|nr:PQQ-dependent sugar dehydrogenase [Pseudomonas xionganensis]